MSSAEQEARRSIANKLFQENGNRRVEVNLAKTVRGFEPLFDPTVMNLLMNEDGQEVRRDMLVNLDTKRLFVFESPQTAPTLTMVLVLL